ncbi:hypothetical protein [Caldimonas tepidiphila]|uniref:hypothetical protein n=1 Tax=Caldimonas tepidiphila TaxID=2315841 RepID=UPI000E5B3975|nr:hypothetical protein [Caldimonas tepidiphila]
MNASRTFLAAALLAATATLAACGGGGGDGGHGPDSSGPVALTGPGDAPGSAARSVSDFIGYLMQVAGLQPENAEPVGIGGLVPPASETDEPVPLS